MRSCDGPCRERFGALAACVGGGVPHKAQPCAAVRGRERTAVVQYALDVVGLLSQGTGAAAVLVEVGALAAQPSWGLCAWGLMLCAA